MSQTLRTLAAIFVGTLFIMAGAVGSASAAGPPGAIAVQKGLQDLAVSDSGLQKVHYRRHWHRYHRRHRKLRRYWRDYSYYPYYYSDRDDRRRHRTHRRHSYRKYRH